MAGHEIAVALQRAEAVFLRRPEAALHEDAPGVVCWAGGTRMVSTHPNGSQVVTDMPAEYGGSGDQVSPGWLLRSSVAACAATSIALVAAREGIALDRLEVHVTSRSDARGLLGMDDGQGAPVYPGPQDLAMQVLIRAAGVAPGRLHELVEEGGRRAPNSSAIRDALAMPLRIEVEAG